MTEADRISSLVRWRAGLTTAAVALPLVLFGVFERQARRLDALAVEGEAVLARVTRASERYTDYAYRVDGRDYDWNVAREEAPHAEGETFTATYLPSDPSLSRPTAERAQAAAEAEEVRSRALKVALGALYFFGFFALLMSRELRRRRAGAPSEVDDPIAYRRRIGWTLAGLLPLLVGISWFHARDAVARGQSVAPVVLGGALSLGVIGGVIAFVAGEGPREARARAAKLVAWTAPVAVALLLLRVLWLSVGD